MTPFFCSDLANREPGVEGGIYQWSGLEKVTKWDIIQLIGQQTGLRKAIASNLSMIFNPSLIDVPVHIFDSSW